MQALANIEASGLEDGVGDVIPQDVLGVELSPGCVELGDWIAEAHAFPQRTQLCVIPIGHLHLGPMLDSPILLEQQGLALPRIIPEPATAWLVT